jgi:4-hydroxyphenylpyruvate dioxygenase
MAQVVGLETPSIGGAKPRFAVSTACLSGSLEEKLNAAAAAGFGSVELLMNDLMLSDLTPRRVRSVAARLETSIEVLQPLHVEALPDPQFQAVLRRAQRAFDVAGDLGSNLLLLCSTRSAYGLDDDQVAAEQLHELAERAAHRGIRLAYEAVPWGRVASHDHAWSLVERVDHPNLGLCLDSFHVLSQRNELAAIGRIPTAKVFHVQLADSPQLHPGDRHWSLHNRILPGQGVLEIAGLVRHLVEHGYSGVMALEVFNDVYQQEDPWYAATGAMRALRILAESAERGDESSPSTRLFNVSLPTAPSVSGFAFVELAVDDVSEPVLAEALTALGFAHAAQHRSKPVQLWVQGGIRLLLNRAPHRATNPATASICAFAVETPNPKGFAARASSLSAQQLHRLRNPDESDLESVAAPDGTAVFFCDSGERGGWLDDFVSTGNAAASPTMALTTIDHISLTESIDDFGQTALFYQGVLGLRSAGTEEAIAPFGLVRSWSALDPEGRVRISLSTAPLRRGDWAPAVSSTQHVAFATDDAVACAANLKAAAGARLLPMPSNYYDDLESRTDLPKEVIGVLREHSVLYDKDEHGEYLHFFTRMYGSRIFFEVVQRINGYASLGASNSTALRMAAHRQARLSGRRSYTGGKSGPGRADAEPEAGRAYSLAHLTALSLSPPELVDAAAAAGYQYVGLRLTKVTMEEPHYPLTQDPALMRATQTHLAATGVRVLDIELARLTSSDNPRDYLRFLEAGAELRARHVIAQLPDANFDRKVERFAELCQLAKPLGLTINLEFPSWTETGTLDEATRVLRAANQSNAGMLIDLLHFARSDSSIEALADLPRDWFNFVHVCDAPAKIPRTTQGLIHTARFERLSPGEGGIGITAILDALPDNLPYALEIPKAMLTAQVGAREHARIALAATKQYLEAKAADLAP